MNPNYRGIVVAHTHWDRAWYLPFQSFRLRLVRLIDRLIELLEQNSRFRAFTLDGQTVLLEDYLEIRPEQKQRLRDLIAAGRLLIGPWYTMPDLFLVSGEAIIRNLQWGQKLCQAFGGQMPVGYVPDPFGHFAQMPQVLRGFGIDTYIFMRGLDAETKATHGAVFDWVAPDGSTVLAIYQPLGYFPAAALGHPGMFGRFEGHAVEVSLAKERIDEAVAVMGQLQAECTLLLSNGFDHMPPQPELPDLLEELRDRVETITLEQGTFPEFINALKSEQLAHRTYSGDLLGNADQPILSSVYSTRMYLKQQNHLAQRLLVQYAEPISVGMEAWGLGEDVRAFLDKAWQFLLRNHPHDDICGCSVDPVHDDDEYRFRQVEQIAEAILVEHLEHLLQKGFVTPAHTDSLASDVWVFNPHPWSQTYAVEASILIPNPDGEWGEPRKEQKLIGCDGQGNLIAIHTLNSEGRVARSRYLETTWGRRYDLMFTLTLPPLGYQLVHIYEQGTPAPKALDKPLILENDFYRLVAEPQGLKLTEKATGVTFPDVLRFEYQLDSGDTYSFSAVPEHAPRWATLEGIQWHRQRPNTLRLTHRLTVPASYQNSPEDEITLRITTDVWLTPHRSFALSISYENQAENGRLRVVFPVGLATRNSLADGHFRLAPRQKTVLRTPESDPERYQTYPGELDYPTHHQGDFVIVEGSNYRVWVANRGLPEYELLNPENNTQIAITLHRAVGYLSVGNGRIRRCQAGPSVSTPGAQCKRAIKADLAYGLAQLSQESIIRHARAFACPAWVREMPYLPYVKASGQLPRRGSLLQISNPWIILSAFKTGEEKGRCVLRLYNTSDQKQTTEIRLGFASSAWCMTTLLDTWNQQTAQPIHGQKIELTLSPYQICTIALQI